MRDACIGREEEVENYIYGRVDCKLDGQSVDERPVVSVVAVYEIWPLDSSVVAVVGDEHDLHVLHVGHERVAPLEVVQAFEYIRFLFSVVLPGDCHEQKSGHKVDEEGEQAYQV